MVLQRMKNGIALLCGLAFLLCGCVSPQEAVVVADVDSSNAAFVDTLVNQKTVQAFTDEAVASEDLTMILEAGVNAPSAMNAQPWHFSVIRDNALLTEISANMSFGGGTPPAGMTPPDAAGEAQIPPEGTMEAPTGNGTESALPVESDGDKPAVPGGSVTKKLSLADATVAIVVSGTANMSTDSFDCGLACDRMSVAAMALGYGVKIVSSPAGGINASYQEQLGIPDDMEAIAVLLIGVTDVSYDSVSSATTRNALDDVVTYVD